MGAQGEEGVAGLLNELAQRFGGRTGWRYRSPLVGGDVEEVGEGAVGEREGPGLVDGVELAGGEAGGGEFVEGEGEDDSGVDYGPLLIVEGVAVELELGEEVAVGGWGVEAVGWREGVYERWSGRHVGWVV